MIPEGSYTPIDLEKYSRLINLVYANKYPYSKEGTEKQKEQDTMIVDLKRAQAIARETFLAGYYLPCHHDLRKSSLVSGNKAEILIGHPDISHVDFLCIADIPKLPTNKHLSINTMKVSYKQVKKVMTIRQFAKPASVFRDWVEDTKTILDQAFELDAQFLKNFKFIKDKEDLAATEAVLREYFVPLKAQYLNQISNPKFYPVITWLDYSLATSQWRIVDRNLTSTDIDRLFIATNYEEVDLDNNDDNSLCRYEFFEIIARMGKVKYFEKGICKTIHESTRRLIEDHLLAYPAGQMPWHEFRVDRLWNLDVDDLFKANKVGIAQIYDFVKRGEHTRDQNALTLDDALKFVQYAGYEGP